MKKTHAPLGLFDSGLGGLTVLQEIARTLPHEQLIYFGDTARVPYGNKSRQTIIRYSIENTIHLLNHDIKLLVVACNTASAFAIDDLKKLFRIPIVGVIEAGARKACTATVNKNIAILGTKGTIESGAYQKALHHLLPDANLFPIACPLFAPLVEEMWLTHPATKLIVEDYLLPLKGKNIDTLVLGCTHYPLLIPIIQECVGAHVTLVDSATACAEQVKDLLNNNNLLSTNAINPNRYFTSDDPDKFRTQASKLFGINIETVELLHSLT